MSIIQDRIKQVQDEQKRLERERLKIEYLAHILESVESYDRKEFKEVQPEVSTIMRQLIEGAIQAIENPKSAGPTPALPRDVVPDKAPQPTPVQSNRPAPELSPSEKMNFALTNRDLGGKKVTVLGVGTNPNQTGEVVGLDAPHVVVRTDTGPIIKVPIEKVVLL